MVVRQPALALLTAAVVVGCSGSGATSDSISAGDSPSTPPANTTTSPTQSTDGPTATDETTDTDTADPTTTSAPADSTPATSTPATSTPATSTPETSTPPSTEPSSTSPATETSETFTFEAMVPSGEVAADPGALVVLETDGDLVMLPNGLSPGNEAPPIDLLDLADPREPSAEGPGPNFVDDVAGIIAGSVVYGDCCEPVGGNLYAVPAVGQRELFAVGANPNLSPDGDRLATANSSAITMVDLASGDGFGVQLNQGPDTLFNSITDLEWVDDATLATLGIVEEEFELTLWDAATLTELAATRVDGLADLDQARFAGRTSDGMLAVEVTGPDLATVRMFDGLDEDPAARLQFPPTVSGIEIDAAGRGIIWVDGETL
ncbi:MAG: hypothetical protein WA964_01920, partial [Ilumatobacter sp.]